MILLNPLNGTQSTVEFPLVLALMKYIKEAGIAGSKSREGIILTLEINEPLVQEYIQR